MLQNAYFLAKIGADTAENEQHFAEILPKIGNYPTGAGSSMPSAFSWKSVSVEMRPSPCDLLFSSTCAIISQELLPDVTLRLLPPSNIDHGTNDRMVKNASDFLQKGHFSAHSSAIGKEPRGIFRKCPTHLCGYLQNSMKFIKFIWMIMFVV